MIRDHVDFSVKSLLIDSRMRANFDKELKEMLANKKKRMKQEMLIQ